MARDEDGWQRQLTEWETAGIVRSCGPLAVLLRIRPIIVPRSNAPLCAAPLRTLVDMDEK